MAVTRFVIEQRRPFAGGKEWGKTGAYERLDGTAYMEVDPRNPQNAIIVNLDRAPRNERGMVEFSTTFMILKPVDLSRGNHKIFYGVNNRGRKLELGLHAFPPATVPGNNPLEAADAGDGLLLRMGFTFVDAGWQGCVIAVENRIVPKLPVATQADGSPIVSMIRVEFNSAYGYTRWLEGMSGGGPFVGGSYSRPYETADTDTTHSTLTVRDSVDGPRRLVAPDRWAFGRGGKDGSNFEPSTTDICIFDGFDFEKIYELIYPAKNPIVMGLGYAVTRDVGSFLRYQSADDFGNRNPLLAAPDDIRLAYASGRSSTGMYLRDWLYLGFNEDEEHRKVFDAISINICGATRLFANIEFAAPNMYTTQDIRHDFLSCAVPPLTFGVTTDPLTGIHDGILKRPETDPLVFQIDSATEFWQLHASLNVADGLGRPIPTPDNVRLYFLPAFSHSGSASFFDPAGSNSMGLPADGVVCETAMTPLLKGTAPINRALMVALDQWADKGVEPPLSNYPRVENGTLVSREEAERAFPRIPGVSFPTVVNELEVRYYGPEFSSVGGRLTVQPPLMGPNYKVMVPKPDSDGIDSAPVRPIQASAPIATNTGWAVRAPGSRAPDLAGLAGAVIPFAKTLAERKANGDPRPSLTERYQSHAGFVAAVREECAKLIRERYMLAEDAAWIVKAAEDSAVLK